MILFIIKVFGIILKNKKKQNDKDAIVHEILHAMGLKHTFDDGNLFVFRENDTDNIMDYDEIAVGGEKNSPDKLHLWKWQIDILRENAKNNKFIRKP